MVVYTFNVIEEIGSRRERERSMQVMLPLYVRSGPGHIATTFKPIQVYSIIYNKRQIDSHGKTAALAGLK